MVYARQADTPLPRTGYNENVWRMNADGTGQTLLIDNQFYDAQAEWSPDGTTIAFASGTEQGDETWDIWTMDPNGGNLTQVTDDAFPDFQPEWRNVPPA